jgi:hypothetical protein
LHSNKKPIIFVADNSIKSITNQLTAQTGKCMKVKRKTKVSFIGKAIGTNAYEIVEGKMYNVSVEYGDFSTEFQIFAVKHNAKKILGNLKEESIVNILSGKIGYYNSNDPNDNYFAEGRFDFIVKKQEQEQE